MTTPFDIETVVSRFAPQVRFHPEEVYFASSVEWYLARVGLVHVTSPVHAKRPATFTPVLGKGEVNSLSLVSQQVDDDLSGGESRGTFYLEIPHDRDHAKTCAGDLRSARCYVHVQLARPGRWHLIYLFCYPYNGAIAIDPNITHEGDWEHIKVEVDGAGETLQRIFFAAHAGGKWCSRYSTTEGNTDGFRCADDPSNCLFSPTLARQLSDLWSAGAADYDSPGRLLRQRD